MWKEVLQADFFLSFFVFCFFCLFFFASHTRVYLVHFMLIASYDYQTHDLAKPCEFLENGWFLENGADPNIRSICGTLHVSKEPKPICTAGRSTAS